MAGGIHGGDEPEHHVTGAFERRELLREFDDTIEELRGTLLGDAGVAQRGAHLAGFGDDGFGLGLGEEVLAHGAFGCRVVADDDRAPGASVVPLVDGADAPRAYHLQQAGVDEDVDVVGDRRLRPIEGGGQFGDRRRPLEHEVEDQAAHRFGDRLQLLGSVGGDALGEVVVGSHTDRISDLSRMIQ